MTTQTQSEYQKLHHFLESDSHVQENFVSFDIFDTTLSRLWEKPDHLFFVLGRKLAHDGVISISEQAFYELRQASEKEFRKASASGETTLTDIYQKIASHIGNSNPEFVAQLIEHEMALEAASIRPIQGMMRAQKALSDQNRPWAFLSDTYFSEPQIERLLKASHASFSGIWPDNSAWGKACIQRKQLVLSHTHEASKKRGDLFLKLKNLFSSTVYLHVGDKKTADGTRAEAAGFKTFVFQSQAQTRAEKALAQSTWPDILTGSAVAGSSRSARMRDNKDDPQSLTLKAFGANIAGPFLASFTAWALKKSHQHGVERLLFLARDGQILHRIAEKLEPQNASALRYAYGSRQALYLPAVLAVNDQPWNWLSAKMAGRSVRDVLTRFGIAADFHAITMVSEIGFSPEKILENQDVQRFQSLLSQPALADLILAEARRRRGLVQTYLSQEIGEAQQVALIDVGWKGRLQICLQRILDDHKSLSSITLRGFYCGLEAKAAALETGRAEAFLPFSKIPNAVLVELMTMADHGTTTGYREEDGRVVPQLASLKDEEALDWGVLELQSGITDFVDDLRSACALAALDLNQTLEALKEPALKNFQVVVDNPLLSEAKAIGSFHHSDDQAHAGSLPIASHLQFKDLWRLAFYGCDRVKPRTSFWPQASFCLSGARQPVMATAIKAVDGVRARVDGFRPAIRRLKQRLR